MIDEKRRGLGRGLSALFGEEAADELTEAPQGVRSLPIELIHPSRYQPRHNFDEEGLASLAESIKAQGILKPLLVRRHPEVPEHYEIIAGERRWRAAQLAQLHEVPVVLKELADRDVLEIAIVENVQRQDLSPLEEAEGYRRLIEEFAHTQEDLAQRVGKSRSHIANTLRLLTLPDDVRGLLQEGKITAGHARALLGVEGAGELAREVVRRGMSVREVERAAKARALAPEKMASLAGQRDADTESLERELTQLLGLKVQVMFSGEGGMLSIHYRTLDQLEDVLRRLRTYSPTATM